MKKVYLTEEQFIRYLAKNLCESIISEKGPEGKPINAFARRRAQDVINYIINKAKTSGDDSEIIQLAREYGINLDYLKGQMDKEQYQQSRETAKQNFTNEKVKSLIAKYLPALRLCFTTPKGVTDKFQKSKEQAYVNKDGSVSTKQSSKVVFDKLPRDAQENVLKLKDLLDKLRIPQLYRDTPDSKFGKFVGTDESGKKIPFMKYGINLSETDATTDINSFINDFDLTKISDDEAFHYYADGSRYDTINDKLKQQGVNVDFKKKKRDTFNGSETIQQIAYTGLLNQRIDRYLDRIYGVSLDFGADTNMFKFGNAKIHNDTLVVNFESAMRCPAWNECIMKDACYAKTSEMNYDDALSSNLKKGFIWTQTKADQTLMEMMCLLIRSCLVNYQEAWKQIRELDSLKQSQGYQDYMSSLQEAKTKTKELTQEEGGLFLSKKTFQEIRDEYGQEALDILQSPGVKMGSVVRLNENGDFIGQWLVDAWDKLAVDFDLIGVKVAAYTCRALNYENVKKMILNISQAGLVSRQKSDAFAHFFYAIAPQEYDGFEETYNGQNHSLLIDPKTHKITPVYRNLIDENGKLVGYYYKCPCGREKYKYVPFEPKQNEMGLAKEHTTMPTCFEFSDKFIKVGGEFFKKIKSANPDAKADCYMCRICYGRNKDTDISVEGGGKPQPGLPVFVFVATHGQNQNNFKGTQNDYRRVLGRKVTDWIEIQKAGKQNELQPMQVQENINENEIAMDNIGANDDAVVKQITNNMVYSVANHMAGGINKVNEIKTNFKKTLKMLK